MMTRILNIAFFIIMLGIMINGICMLISPSMWGRLPWWIRGISKGSIAEIKGGDSLLRIAGAGFLLFAAIFINAYFHHK